MTRLVLAIWLALGGASLAQPAPAPPSDEPAMQAYPDKDATCLEWSDGCRSCLRTGTIVACGNIGIACQPNAIVCVRREEPPKPPAEPPKEGAPK